MSGGYIMDYTDVMSCLNIIDDQIQKSFAYKNAIEEIKKLCIDDDGILAWDILNIINFM